jgi:hypothetical protein
VEATAEVRVSAELLTGRKNGAALCGYLDAHARRLYATVTGRVRVGAALLASRMAQGRLASPFTAREVYRNDWTGLTEPRVVGEALDPGARLDPARGGPRPGRGSAHGTISHQPSGDLALRTR